MILLNLLHDYAQYKHVSTLKLTSTALKDQQLQCEAHLFYLK